MSLSAFVHLKMPLSVIRSFLLAAIIFVIAPQLHSQSKTDLEKKRNKIIKEIEKTNSYLKKTSKEKESTLTDISAINSQVSNRAKLVDNVKQQLEMSDHQIKASRHKIDSLTTVMESLKLEYAKIIRYDYFQKLSNRKWTYLLSARSLNDFFLRWRYRQQFAEFQNKKQEQILALQNDIRSSIDVIEHESQQKQELLEVEKENLQKLEREKKQKNNLLKKISKKEKRLKKSLNAKKKKREKLNKEIENIIIAQLKASKSNDSKSIAMSREFGSNKGKLPWPVSGGFISARFGKQPHPTLKGIEIEKNGIDISLRAAANVKSVFDGEVVGVRSIPGHQTMIIIKHGDYYTVYSNLSQVSISAKQKVKAGQSIGSVALQDGNSLLHFELWKGKSKLDPQPWLR